MAEPRRLAQPVDGIADIARCRRSLLTLANVEEPERLEGSAIT
jgi:hypothetical protein